MQNHLHHVHIFASDVDRSIEFYREVFGGEVVTDMKLAGARNVFIRIGNGRLHLYDQPPRDTGKGGIHHFGIQSDDIEGVVKRINDRGLELKKDVKDFGVWSYIMIPAPDDILIEVFQVNRERMPPELSDYFE